MTKSRRISGNPRRGGFTLFELVVVMVMLFVLAGVVAPRFTDFVPALQVAKTADRILAWAVKARSEAALTGGRQRLVIDLQERAFWIESERRPLKEPGVFAPPALESEREPIAEEVALETRQGLQKDGAGRSFLEFTPDGTAADATIVVANDRGDRRTIRVVGATSHAYIEAAPQP